jgi:hypothetical protein
MGKINAHRILIKTMEGKDYSEDVSVRWTANPKISLRGKWREGVYSINVAWDRGMWRAFVDTVMNLRIF